MTENNVNNSGKTFNIAVEDVNALLAAISLVSSSWQENKSEMSDDESIGMIGLLVAGRNIMESAIHQVQVERLFGIE